MNTLFSDELEIDPIVINRAKFYVKALYIATVYANKEYTRGETLKVCDTLDWFVANVSSESIFVELINNADKALIELIDENFENTEVDSVGALYERLLNVETSGDKVVKSKGFRNNLGSYYTPIDMAQSLVAKTIDSYKGDITTARVVDFSCGAGVFLITALDYICAKYSNNKGVAKSNIALNIHACDVDLIALEIAKLSVLKFAEDYTLYARLSENFIHANFLIHSENSVSDAKRQDVAMSDMIYHKDLSINTSSLQKYDIILGNPPWEKIRFEEKTFYSKFSDKLSGINFKFDLPKAIARTTSNNKVKDYAEYFRTQLESAKREIKNSSFFNISNIGELNTCTLFANAAYNLLSDDGVFGLVVKSSLITTPVNRTFFNAIKCNICAVFDFINKRKIFDIDSRERFSLLIVDKHKKNSFTLGMNLESAQELELDHLQVSIDDLNRINPNTGMLPNVGSKYDFELLLKLHKQEPTLEESFKGVKFGRLVHLTNHIADISTCQTEENIPVYEGKFFNQFDALFSGFNNVSMENRLKSKATSVPLTKSQKENGEIPMSRFFISKKRWNMLSKSYSAEYMLAWRSLTSATNSRSCIAAILPFMPASQSVQFLVTKDDYSLLYLLGIFNSVVFDYIIKRKLSGIDLTQSILNQTPVPAIKNAKSTFVNIEGDKLSLADAIVDISKALLANDSRLTDLCAGRAIQQTNKSRIELISLLDCVVAKLYDITSDEFEYILKLFPKQYNSSDVAKLRSYHAAFIQ